ARCALSSPNSARPSRASRRRSRSWTGGCGRSSNGRCTDVATKQTERPQYFENQYLGAADLTAAVEYARSQQARHALGGHTWGIAMGLDLVEKASSSVGGQVDVFVQPGFAWDGFGRPVVVLSPYKLSPEEFKSFTYDAGVDGGSPEGRLVEVWLRYSETETQGAPAGFEVCYPSDQFTRVDEFF